MDYDYSDIRYYGEDDLKGAIERVVKEPSFERICRYIFPEMTIEDAKKRVLSFETVKSFQVDFIIDIIRKLVANSIDELTSSGTENLSKDGSDKYLFITNHRNIVMDASLLNYQLLVNFSDDFESTAIAIGNNLLGIPWVKDMARLNKSFVVIRDASVQKMLENSKKLSTYMRMQITEKISSVWIAQREGRAKNGNDTTQPGLLKMFQMSGAKDFVENYGELHIVPVAISYEYDPCVIDKVKELADIESTGKHEKEPMDDFNSMSNGLTGYKGRVHLSFGSEITPEILRSLDGNIPKNEKIKHLAEYIDNFIHTNYKLWPNNYIATDILLNNKQFVDFYSSNERTKFENFMSEKLKDVDADEEQKKIIFLKMWANPVKNAFKNNSKYSFWEEA